MFNKLKTIILSPLFIFGILAVAILSFLITNVNFQLPSYYTNIGLAQQIADAHGDITSVINPTYHKFNYTFNVFSFCLALFIICLLFKVKTFKDFSKLCTLKNKRNISIWVNISYLLWASLSYRAWLYHDHLYVYPWDGDSWSIPMFSYAISLFLLGVIYYIFMNFWCSVLYQGKLSSKVKGTVTTILCLFTLYNIIAQFNYRYSLFYTTCLFALSFVWLAIVISLSRLNIENEDYEKTKINFSWILFFVLSVFLSVCYFIPLLKSFVINNIETLPFILAIILTFIYTDVINKKLNPKVREILGKAKAIIIKILITVLCILVLIPCCFVIMNLVNDNIVQPIKYQIEHPQSNYYEFKYIQQVQDTIKRNWNPYPSNEKCQILVKFRVDTEGKVSSIQVISSNASKDNNDKAIETIKNSAPFKSLPKKLNKEGYVDIEFTFDIN